MTKIIDIGSTKQIEITALDCKPGCFYRDNSNRIWFSPPKLTYTTCGSIVYLFAVGHNTDACINPNMLLKEEIEKVIFE